MNTSTAINTLEAQNNASQQQPFLPPRLGLNHLPLTNPRTYYRSKVWTATTGVNTLVTAAASLLTSAANLRDTTYPLGLPDLYQDLVHEIRAFETQAQMQGYRSDLILVTRYILCATLDEIILNTAWGTMNHWQRHTLLATFHGEEWGGERFFLILERLSADVVLHLDVLELIYLCLSLGFTGKYRLLENGYTELNKVTEELYQCIRWQRGDIKKELLLREDKTNERGMSSENEPIPIWTLCTIVGFILITLYIVFNILLGSHASPLYQQLNSLLHHG